MTPAERNRALAEALEGSPPPLEPIRGPMEGGKFAGALSPKGLFQWDSWKGWIPRDFHADGNAMLALIAAVERMEEGPRLGFEAVSSTHARFRRSGECWSSCHADTLPHAVALAASRALGIET